MRGPILRLGCLTLMVVATFVASAARAGAVTPAALTCGATITANVALQHDLVGCHGDGLVVGAPGITIDLRGHTISGTNAPGGEGVADDGFGHVVVENGTIRRFFENAVGLRGAPASVVRGLTILAIGAGGVENQFSSGVTIDGSPGTRITGNSISNDVVAWEADGVVVKRSAGARIDNNRLNRNSWEGLFVLASPNSQVDHNVANGNPNNGMEIKGATDFTRVTDNETSGNGNIGIAVGSMQGAVIDRNTAALNGFAAGADGTGLLFFDLRDSEIAQNRTIHNLVGIDLFGGLDGSTGNRVAGNVASENAIIGLVIDSGEGGTVTNGANHNVVMGNTANSNRGAAADDGAGIGVFGTGNVLRQNEANGNTANGILVGAAGNTLGANSAERNDALGIVAVGGTIDGGGNHARRNLPPQCLGVACR